MPIGKPQLLIGSRFKMSALGGARSPCLAEKEGTIVGRTPGNGVRVVVDGNKAPTALHRHNVEPIKTEDWRSRLDDRSRREDHARANASLWRPRARHRMQKLQCSHSVHISADRWSDNVRLSDLEPCSCARCAASQAAMSVRTSVRRGNRFECS
jgi:hypothetical protein